MTNDGKKVPYGPWKYRKIVEECYLISHQIHTSYLDMLQITPMEKDMMLKFINDELKVQKESYDRLKAKRESMKRDS